MQDFQFYEAFNAALATPPAQLKGRVEKLIGGGNYSTALLPVVVGEQQYVQLGFCQTTGARPDAECWLSAPFATLTIAYPDQQITWRDTQAAHFGMSTTVRAGDPTEYVGVIDRQGITVQELNEARTQYPQLVLLVLERRWLVTRHAPTAEERTTAQQLQQYVRVLYDKVLLPYYQQEGRHFLAWIARAAS